MENIFVEFLPPWVETGLQPAFYDKESGTVLQQTARMYARVNMLIRMFNKLSKETKTTVDHYVEEFTTLYNYVHDYFDNLDVQEEINNKLDQMAEDGTLQEIITAYIQSNVAWTFDTVADMKTATNLVNGSYAQTLGYYTVNDGGASIFKISSTNSNTDFSIPLLNDLYAILVVNEKINIKQLGAKGENVALSSVFDTLADAQALYPNAVALTDTVDTTVLEYAIETYYQKVINIPAGNFYLNRTITPSHGYLHIVGHSYQNTQLWYTVQEESETNVFNLTSNSQRNTFENFLIRGPYDNPETSADSASFLVNGFACVNSSYNTFNKIETIRLLKGIFVNGGFVTHLNDCYLHRCYYGLHMYEGGVAHNSLIEYTKIQHCYIGAFIGSGRGIAVNNCDFENDDIGLVKTNTGTISIFQCYFEDHIEIRFGSYYVHSVLIDSCSFHLMNQTERIPFIRFHGDQRNTKITISNNYFYSQGGSINGPCIQQISNDTPVSPMTVNPILINNMHQSITNLVDTTAFCGTLMTSQINNNLGKVNVKYYNITNNDGGTLVLDELNYTYRLAGGSNHSASIQVPYITNVERNNREYTFYVPETVSAGATDTFTFTPENVSSMNILNPGPHTLDSARGKTVKVRYMDDISGKRTWQVMIS